MKKTNLSVYCDKMDVDEVNGLLARMNELRSAVYSLKEQYETDDDTTDINSFSGFYDFEEDRVRLLVEDVNKYMTSLGYEIIFDVNTVSPTKEDYKNIILQYNYLMSDIE